MGVACACMEERTHVSEELKMIKRVQEDTSLYGSIGRYEINKQTGTWKSMSGVVFLGHMTEGKVLVDREETFV